MMTDKLIMVTGGARSGKSSFAEKLASMHGSNRAYLATAQALDSEMRERIERHKTIRGEAWVLYEEPLAVATLLDAVSGRHQVLLFDCLTMWISNMMLINADIQNESATLVKALRDFRGTCIVVSNEVGLGIVPDNPLARMFRDAAGMLNQQVAEVADEVYVSISGIPLRLK